MVYRFVRAFRALMAALQLLPFIIFFSNFWPLGQNPSQGTERKKKNTDPPLAVAKIKRKWKPFARKKANFFVRRLVAMVTSMGVSSFFFFFFWGGGVFSGWRLLIERFLRKRNRLLASSARNEFAGTVPDVHQKFVFERSEPTSLSFYLLWLS